MDKTQQSHNNNSSTPKDVSGINLVTALNPKVIEALASTIKEAKIRGLNVALHSGVRLAEEQEKLYRLGRTVMNPDGKTKEKPLGNIITNARAYESWHSFGLAVDVVFKDAKGWTWNKTPKEWGELGEIGEMFGFSWGGQWTKFPDYPHFQVIGKLKNVQQAKALLLEKGIEEVWSHV